MSTFNIKFYHNILLSIIAASMLTLSACRHHADVTPLLSIDDIINSQESPFIIKNNQIVIINTIEKHTNWQVSLGRLDVKNAEFEYFNNKTQKQFSFTQAGRYQLTIRARSSGGAPNIEQHILILLVED